MINCELCSFWFQVTWEIEKVYNLGPVVKRVKPRPQSTLSGSFYISRSKYLAFKLVSAYWCFSLSLVFPSLEGVVFCLCKCYACLATPQLNFFWSGKKPCSSKWFRSLFVMRADSVLFSMEFFYINFFLCSGSDAMCFSLSAGLSLSYQLTMVWALLLVWSFLGGLFSLTSGLVVATALKWSSWRSPSYLKVVLPSVSHVPPL